MFSWFGHHIIFNLLKNLESSWKKFLGGLNSAKFSGAFSSKMLITNVIPKQTIKGHFILKIKLNSAIELVKNIKMDPSLKFHVYYIYFTKMFIYLLQHVRQGARNVSNYKPCIRRLPFLNCLFLISFHNDGESEALFFLVQFTENGLLKI